MRKKMRICTNIFLLMGALFCCLLLLFLGEGLCRVFTDVKFQRTSRDLLTENGYGTSIGNAKNFEAISFGAKVYTDEFGFRVPRNGGTSSSDYESAILILGDSVGFGVGLEEAETAAGLLRKEIPSTKIYNSSVIGYYTYDYKNVIESFLPLHEEVKTVYLLFCLNDLSPYSTMCFDENNKISIETDGFFKKIITKIGKNSLILRMNMFLRAHSKLYIFFRGILAQGEGLFLIEDNSLYSERNKAIFLEKMRYIADISVYLKKKNIPFTVIIMPYEYQLRTHDEKLMIPQQKLTEFFNDEGINYIDAVSEFRNSETASKDFYLAYDPTHFSKKGNEILSNIIVRDIANRGN